MNTSNNELQIIISKMWNSMSESDKAPYYTESKKGVTELLERNPGHKKFKRGPNKTSRPIKKIKTTSETLRINFPDYQTVFRVKTPDVEVVSEGDRPRK